MLKFWLGILLAMLSGYGMLPAEAQDLDTPKGVIETDDPELVSSKPGAKIGFDEVDARMLQIPAERRAGFVNDPERIERMLQNLMLMRQIATAARAEGLDKDPLIEAEMMLATEEVLAKRLLAQHDAALKIPDFSLVAEERYLANPDLFQTDPTVDVRHLVIKRDIHGAAAAKALADQLRARFLAEGGDFEAFVKAHSEEPRADLHGGLVNTLIKGKAAGAFEEAAFALEQPGDISEVISTQFGYHIIQLVKRQDGVRRTFEQVKPEIVQQLESEYRLQERNKLVDSYRAQPMTANPDNVLALRTRYLPGSPGELRLRPFGAAAAGDVGMTEQAGSQEGD